MWVAEGSDLNYNICISLSRWQSTFTDIISLSFYNKWVKCLLLFHVAEEEAKVMVNGIAQLVHTRARQVHVS